MKAGAFVLAVFGGRDGGRTMGVVMMAWGG